MVSRRCTCSVNTAISEASLDWPDDETGSKKTAQQKKVYDPNWGARNLMSRPVSDLQLFVANTDFSGGCGWANPALVLTERILFHHLLKALPSFILDTCNDCVTGSISGQNGQGTNCDACISKAWYYANVASFPAAGATARCDDSTGQVASKCWQPPQVFTEKCNSSFNPAELNLLWRWPNDTHIEITFRMAATSWVGFGMGSSMASADIIAGWLNSDDTVSSGHFRSADHVAPLKIDKPFAAVTSQSYVNGVFTITFQRPAQPSGEFSWAQVDH